MCCMQRFAHKQLLNISFCLSQRRIAELHCIQVLGRTCNSTDAKTKQSDKGLIHLIRSPHVHRNITGNFIWAIKLPFVLAIPVFVCLGLSTLTTSITWYFTHLLRFTLPSTPCSPHLGGSRSSHRQGCFILRN